MSDTKLLIEEVRNLPDACVGEALELITKIKQKYLQNLKAPSSKLSGLDAYVAENSSHAIEDALQMAEAKAADSNCKLVSRHFETLPGILDLPPAYSTQEALRISAEKAAVRRANPALNTLKKYHGCLKDSPNFGCDGMEIQRELRNEWESICS